jgi:PhoH-like ATPase
MTKILVDTNLLLDEPNILFKLKVDYDKIVMSIVVLKELDKHKNNPDLSYSARAAISSIKEFQTKHPDSIEFVVNTTDLSNNDELIIEAARQTGATIATKDISMSIISESKEVPAKLYGNIANGIYNPYLYTTTREITEGFTYQQAYTDVSYHEAFDYLVGDKPFVKNSWFFAFIEAEGKSTMVYANNPLKSILERIDNLPTYRSIENDKMTVKARDLYQVCAIYALENSPHVLITGKWGSGKTLLSTSYAIANNLKKTFISRPPVGIDRKYEIGFLPGSVQEKLASWAMGFLSAVYFLFGNTNLQEKDGKGYDFVKEEIFKKLFELIDANSLQGLSLLDDYLLVDEVQYCTIDLMSMILSRATDESRIILMGDLAQSYSIKPSNSGLLKLLRAMPHESMAYVNLKHSYRSNLLELAEKLQDKAF